MFDFPFLAFKRQKQIYHIHLVPAEQISNQQSVDLVGTELALNSRPEKVETDDDGEQNTSPNPEVMVQAKKKNRSFLNRLFRRK